MPRSKSLRIVVVGGGSNAWTPNLVKDMLLTDGLENSRFILYDINLKAAEFVAEACRTIARGLNKPANIVATDDRKAAFKGADYFLITISTGGFDAMAHDLKIPEKFGIYHTVGDTSGPGGWARLIRNFDVFVDLANDFNRYAPNAPVLNYTNPMTTLTMVLSRICKVPVIGLCHGLFENLYFFKKIYNIDNEQEITTRYAGLNHFFWITEVIAGGIDILADLRKRLKNKTITDLKRETTADAFGFHSHRELATELFLLTGALPYLGDRHTCEFVSWGITDKKRMDQLKLRRTTIAERRKAFNARNVHFRKLIRTDNIDDYKTRSRESAADIIQAHAKGKTFIDVGNTTNIGQVENLPRGVVVETPVRIDPLGFTPLTYGKLPPQVLALVEPHAHAFTMVVDACFEKNREKALQALRLDPVCSHLGTPQVRDLGGRLLKAHKKFIRVF